MRRSHLLLVSTIGLAVLYLAAASVLGSTPGPDKSGQYVISWFQEHGGHIRTWLWLTTLSAPLFATYAGLIRRRLPSPHRDVFFFGAIALGVETAVQGWFWAGLAWHPGQLDAAMARTLLDVASYWGPVLTGTTITMIAPVVLLSLQNRPTALPRWVGVLGLVAVAEQSVETVTIFGSRGFIAPGGPMNLLLGAGLVGAWVVCLGVVMGRMAAPSSVLTDA